MSIPLCIHQGSSSILFPLSLFFLLSLPSLYSTSRHHSPPIVPSRSPIPYKLLQGCPSILLHSRYYGHLRLQCRMQPSTAVAAYEGVKDAMKECANLMRFLPWDCSQTEDLFHDPILLKYGWKESAFLWALSSAGAVWGIATSCTQGWLAECECWLDKDKKEWEWEGCSGGVQYALSSSRKLLTRTTSSSNSALHRMEKHNLKAGRLAVKKTATSQCKCHGVSGSCQQKTCWKQTTTLSSLTKHLLDKYRKASLIRQEEKIRNYDLLYLESSPDHCDRKDLKPRVCAWRNETHSEGDCSTLCCGRGFHITHQVLPYKCDCKFIWCCQLECKECLQHRWLSTCSS